MFYVCFDQMQNNLISQAGQMETNGTPNDLLPAMNQVGCIVLGPLIQELLYPFLHRRRVYLTAVSRIAIGFTFVALSMLYATVVQFFIYRSPTYDDQPGSSGGSSRINVWTQAPLYFLIAAGEIFAYVTALEYAYDRAPKAMKVVVQAVGLLVGGAGSACAMALTPVARDPHLVTFYGSLTVGMAVTTIVFWILFRKYDSSQTAMEVTTGSSKSSLGPMHQVDSHPATMVSDEAPLLKPIDAGAPIELPSSIASNSSQLVDMRGRTASRGPVIPRRSSRRPRGVSDRTSYNGRHLPPVFVLDPHDRLSPGQGRRLQPQAAGVPAALVSGERGQVQSRPRRYYPRTISQSVWEMGRIAKQTKP
jgi:hypothetical protein